MAWRGSLPSFQWNCLVGPYLKWLFSLALLKHKVCNHPCRICSDFDTAIQRLGNKKMHQYRTNFFVCSCAQGPRPPATGAKRLLLATPFLVLEPETDATKISN